MFSRSKHLDFNYYKISSSVIKTIIAGFKDSHEALYLEAKEKVQKLAFNAIDIKHVNHISHSFYYPKSRDVSSLPLRKKTDTVFRVGEEDCLVYNLVFNLKEHPENRESFHEIKRAIRDLGNQFCFENYLIYKNLGISTTHHNRRDNSPRLNFVSLKPTRAFNTLERLNDDTYAFISIPKSIKLPDDAYEKLIKVSYEDAMDAIDTDYARYREEFHRIHDPLNAERDKELNAGAGHE